MAMVDTVLTDRNSCFIKRAFMAQTLCSYDTQPAGFCREFLRTMTPQHGELLLHEDHTFHIFHTSAGTPYGMQYLFEWSDFTSSTSRPPGCTIFHFDQRRVPPLNRHDSRNHHLHAAKYHLHMGKLIMETSPPETSRGGKIRHSLCALSCRAHAVAALLDAAIDAIDANAYRLSFSTGFSASFYFCMMMMIAPRIDTMQLDDGGDAMLCWFSLDGLLLLAVVDSASIANVIIVDIALGESTILYSSQFNFLYNDRMIFRMLSAISALQAICALQAGCTHAPRGRSVNLLIVSTRILRVLFYLAKVFCVYVHLAMALHANDAQEWYAVNSMASSLDLASSVYILSFCFPLNLALQMLHATRYCLRGGISVRLMVHIIGFMPTRPPFWYFPCKALKFYTLRWTGGKRVQGVEVIIMTDGGDMTSHVAFTWCDTCAGMLTTEGKKGAETTETIGWICWFNANAVCHLTSPIEALSSNLGLRGGGGSRPQRHAGRGGRGVGRGADRGNESRDNPSTTTQATNQIVKFLIDGASSNTIVNDIDLLMPATIVYSASQYKTARTGSKNENYCSWYAFSNVATAKSELAYIWARSSILLPGL
jgi:hypothetical protein